MLAVAVLVCVGLAGALAYVLLRNHGVLQGKVDAGDPVVARGPAPGTAAQKVDGAPGPKAAAEGSEPLLAPVQMTAQRMQEIGVTTAVAQYKNVTDALQAPGNV